MECLFFLSTPRGIKFFRWPVACQTQGLLSGVTPSIVAPEGKFSNGRSSM